MPMDPVRGLFWSAVLNGVIPVPVMAVMKWLATRLAAMGPHVVGHPLGLLGWLATVLMGLTVLVMLLGW